VTAVYVVAAVLFAIVVVFFLFAVRR